MNATVGPLDRFIIMTADSKPTENYETKRVTVVALVGLVIGMLYWLIMVFIQFLLSSNPTPNILIAIIEASISMAGGALAAIVGTIIRSSRAILRGAISGIIAGSFLTVATYLMMSDIESTIFLFYGNLALGIWVFKLVSITILMLVGAIAGMIAGAVSTTRKNALGSVSGGALPSLLDGFLLLSVVWIGKLDIGFPFWWIIVASIIGAISGATLGGLFGALGGAIGKTSDSTIGSAIGTAFGGTVGTLISVMFLIPFFVMGYP